MRRIDRRTTLMCTTLCLLMTPLLQFQLNLAFAFKLQQYIQPCPPSQQHFGRLRHERLNNCLPPPPLQVLKTQTNYFDSSWRRGPTLLVGISGTFAPRPCLFSTSIELFTFTIPEKAFADAFLKSPTSCR